MFEVKGTDAAGNVGVVQSYPFMVAASGVQPSVTAPQAMLVGLTTAESGTSATTTANGPLGANTNAVPVSISWTAPPARRNAELQRGPLRAAAEHQWTGLQ